MGSDHNNGAGSTIQVRPVSDAEVQHFFCHGWVKIPGLISREDAARLLDRAKLALGDCGDQGLDAEAEPTQVYESWMRTKQETHEDELFAQLCYSNQIGRNAAQLLGRDSSIRLILSAVMAKLPKGSGRGDPTGFHQDTQGHPYVEGNFLTAWLALDDVGSNMGAMQFYSRSHMLGNLGNLLDPDIWGSWESQIIGHATLSEPVTLQPGDATFHINGTIHGTQANRSKRPRWSWASVMIPGDVRHTGAPSPYTDGLGIEPFGQIDHPKLPIIYPGAGS